MFALTLNNGVATLAAVILPVSTSSTWTWNLGWHESSTLSAQSYIIYISILCRDSLVLHYGQLFNSHSFRPCSKGISHTGSKSSMTSMEALFESAQASCLSLMQQLGETYIPTRSFFDRRNGEIDPQASKHTISFPLAWLTTLDFEKLLGLHFRTRLSNYKSQL